jgi:chromosome segregation ATPase
VQRSTQTTPATTLFQPLTHSWHLSIVRSRTYDEVASSLAQAESLINSLRQTIEGLRNEINTLKAQLERALRENTALSTRLEEAGREIERIGARYANLSAEYRALNERYIAVVGDLRKPPVTPPIAPAGTRSSLG